MTAVAVWLDGECTDREAATFQGVCDRVAAREPETLVVPLHSGEALVALAHEFDDRSVDHLVIAAHGGTTWILDDKFGLTTGKVKYAGQAAVSKFARAWARKMTLSPLVSLAACMCSRAPRWWLQRKFGYIGSDWGARGYLPGGQASLSARIRDLLIWNGVFPQVRGHRTSGHTTKNPVLAVHAGNAGTACRSWWSLENPGLEPTARERRAWVRAKQGQASEDWLMGW